MFLYFVVVSLIEAAIVCIAVVVVIELIYILTKSCSSKGFRVAAAVLL